VGSTLLSKNLAVGLQGLSEKQCRSTLGSDTVKSGVRSALDWHGPGGRFYGVLLPVCRRRGGCGADNEYHHFAGCHVLQRNDVHPAGIAGVVLTIGMAVDANVLIFERIREESAKGKSLRGALSAGYDRAFGTILTPTSPR